MLNVGDLEGLAAVQRACYGDQFLESSEVFERRIASKANCSIVLQRDDAVCAYLVAYRSERSRVTPLHGDFDVSPHPDTLYVHDMAVEPSLKGQGFARMLLNSLMRLARTEGLRYSGLVSVQGTEAFWEKRGYVAHALDDAAQVRNLSTYGDGAVYMLVDLQG